MALTITLSVLGYLFIGILVAVAVAAIDFREKADPEASGVIVVAWPMVVILGTIVFIGACLEVLMMVLGAIPNLLVSKLRAKKKNTG